LNMPAYMIVNLKLRDPAAYEQYKVGVPALVRKHGGEYLVRGGAHEVLEGQWQPSRLVLFRFPDTAAVHAFMNDPEYAPLKAIRQGAADTDAVVVEGL
jgi:uncharacterized protein (DUF1330 family)